MKVKRLLWLMLSILLAAVSLGCDYSPFHGKYSCQGGQPHMRAYCEMESGIPWFWHSDSQAGFNFCPDGQIGDVEYLKVEDDPEFYANWWKDLEDEGKYLAIGGYCDYRDIIDLLFVEIKRRDQPFKDMYMQLWACVPDEYESLAERAKNLGFDVETRQLNRCEE